MELRHLRYFLAVADLQSFTRASEKLFIAQPPLSLQVRQLEEEIGTPLLERHARGVRLTAAGDSFARDARAILEQVERAARQARQNEGRISGVVRLGFVPSASHVMLPRLVRELRARHPTIDVEVEEMITAHQIEALAANRIDFGIARPPIGGRNLQTDVSLVDPFCLAIPKPHPLATVPGNIPLRAIASEQLVGFSRFKAPAFFDQCLHLCTSAGFSPQLRYEGTTIHGVLDLVAAELGIAIVPRTCALIRTENIVFKGLPATVRKGSLALIRRQEPATALASAVIRIMSTVFTRTDKLARLQLQGSGEI